MKVPAFYTYEKMTLSSNFSTKGEDSNPRELFTMTTPVIAQKFPYPIEVTAGESYFWCACGKSARQPFCDGSHADTAFRPIKYVAEESTKVFFCGCKHSAIKPLCDGSHKEL